MDEPVMSQPPIYSVIVCNYNMEGTIGTSIDSILQQVDEKWEIIVVDGGSSDESTELIRNKKISDDRIQLIGLESSPSRHLGRDRQIGVEKANGEYILQHLDADDRIRPYLTEYVDIYHQIERHRNDPFALIGGGPLMAPRDLLLTEPYRNIPAGEDKDLWRRLYDREAVIWLDIPSLRVPLLSEKSTTSTLRRWYEVQIGDFQSGLSLMTYITFLLQVWKGGDYYKLTNSTKESIIKLAMLPFTYLISHLHYENYSVPKPYHKKGARHKKTIKSQVTLSEVEERYEIKIDMSNWSKDAQQFLSN